MTMEIIVSLADLRPREAEDRVDILSKECDTFHIDPVLYGQRSGIIQKLKEAGAERVFAGLNLAGNQDEVLTQVNTLYLEGASMISLDASNTEDTMRRAIGVFNFQPVWVNVHPQSGEGPKHPRERDERALAVARSALNAGVHGIICPLELVARVRALPDARGKALIVFATGMNRAREISTSGATHFVVGTSVTRVAFPVDAYRTLAKALGINLA